MDRLLKRWRRLSPLLRVELIVGGWECFSALLFVSAVLPSSFERPYPLLLFAASLVLSAALANSLTQRGGRGINIAAGLRVVAWLLAFTPGLDIRPLVASFGFGLMAGGIRRAGYGRLLPARVARPQPRSLQARLLPLLGENGMVVGIVGGHVMLLFSVAFLRTASDVVFRAWWEIVPLLAIFGTVVFTIILRPLTRPVRRALRAGPSGDQLLLLRGLRHAQRLPWRLFLLNLAVWTSSTTVGVVYLQQAGDATWVWADAISEAAFGWLFSWGVSVYQRGWHQDTVAPVVKRLRGWTDAPPPSPDPVTLRQRMLSEFGLPLLFTLALSLLAAIGLYRSLGQQLSLKDDLSAIAALCASFAMLVLAVGSVFVRAAQQLSEPLSKLARSADQVASGRLDAAVPRLDGPREVVGLGLSVEHMRRELARTIDELRVERAGLETRVQQRTAELQGALEELKQAQAALIQGERMALIGELVASVAHEIYNPLNAIGGCISSLERISQELQEMLHAYREREARLPAADRHSLEQLRERLDADGALEDLAGVVKVVNNATRRSVTILSNLKSFARAPSEPIPSDVHVGLRETLSLLRHRLAQGGVELVEHFGEVPLITCHAGEINQVFMNLLSNAIAAASTANGYGKAWLEVRTDATPDAVRIIISDNGGGVPEELLQKIFDPFFTTKTGEGTGLGLSISRDIIQRHGGSLHVVNGSGTHGRGASFHCELPLQSPLKGDNSRVSAAVTAYDHNRLRS